MVDTNAVIETYSNEEFGSLRSILIDGDPWFVGKDVAYALGYSNNRKAISDHVDKEDKGVTKCDTLGGAQDLVIINESGLYSLILSSKLPSAKRFKHWVTSEILPSIRKKGYAVDTDHVLQNSSLNHMDSSTPITREELALYFTYLVNGAKDFITAVDKRLDLMEKEFTAVTTALTSAEDVSIKLDSVLSDLLKGITNIPKKEANGIDHERDEIKNWLNKILKSAEIIGTKAGMDSKAVLKEIYRLLREDGVNIDGMYEEYYSLHPGKAKINMIAESEMLRNRAEEVIKMLHRKYYPEKYTVDSIVCPKPIYKSQELLSTPEEVRNCIQIIASREGLVYTAAASRTYKEIEKRCGENLKDLANRLARGYGYSNCSKAYLISHDETLMAILRAIAEGK